jgi:transketolase
MLFLQIKVFFSKEELLTYGKKGTIFGGHPDMHKVSGVEASTGSLGHGLAFGVGMALAAKLDKKDFRVFTLLGDGECQEGSVWEAAMFAPQQRLDNLIAIIDYNKLQAMDWLDNIVSLEPMAGKWKAFGWAVREVAGNSLTQLIEVFQQVPFEQGKPSAIIAHTTKGKGISFMEKVPIWHYRQPNKQEMIQARNELGISAETE